MRQRSPKETIHVEALGTEAARFTGDLDRLRLRQEHANLPGVRRRVLVQSQNAEGIVMIPADNGLDLTWLHSPLLWQE